MRIKIKHLIRGLMFLMFVGFLLLDSQTLLAANASDSVLTGHTGWTFVDGNGIGGLNKDTAQTALNPSLVGFDNALYAAWHETNGAANQIRVKKYDGASWTSVDGDGADGLNKDPAMNAQNPNLAVYNNELYAIWNEQSSSLKYQIRVKKYDGSSWASVDGDGDNGLNKNTAKNGGYPTLVVYNNALYAAWHESHGAVFQIRVKKYDGVSWTFVDGNNDDGLNKVPTKVGKNPSLAIWNNALYTAWYEIGASIGQIRVKKYEGTNWTFVDGDGADGLNRDPAMNAQNPSLAMYNNELYAAWYESNGSANQIRVKKYDGSSWSFIDGNGLAGLNKDFAKDARNPSLAVLDDALYVSWYESNESVSHIRVKKYDGSSWAFVDGNGTIGLNKDVGMETRNPRLTVFNDALYTIWFEFNGTADQIRVAKYNPAIPVTNASAPNIDVQPQDQTINAGGAAELTITASGGVSINYQWYSNTENNNSSGTAIAGATGNTYSAPANIPGTTYYYCVVTNTDNDATGNKTATVSSNTARVVVNTWQPPVIYTNAEAPVINVQPEDKTVNAGDSAELSLSASGVILSYQWYSNNENRNSGGTPIGGADGASYPAPTGTGGTTYYYCIVTNTDYSKTGSQTATNTSNVVRVTVNALTYAEAPVIITQPEGKAVNAGENAELLLSAGGVELSYQWYSSNENSNDGGTPISGATGAIYAASTAIPGTTYYYCIVTNTDNSKTGSQTATNTSNVVGVTIYALTHAEAPVIITQPEDKNVYLGEITDLSLSARGVELSYQWYSNNENSNSRGVPISGAADAIYAASTAIPGTTYYYCIITNTDSSKTGNQTAATTSNVVKVTVILKDAEKPVITIQPEDKTVNIGENTDLSLTASGKELSYQWYSHTENHNNGGTAIAGADGNTYTILTTATGTTYYYCVVTNTDNSKIGVKTAAITSKVVQVTVKALAPGAPANITAVSRNRQAMVSFSPPADNGGSPITGYIVTSHPGDITAIGTGTSIMVTGLTNGIIYTFTVQAVNEVGIGWESTASNAVTPHLGSDESNPGGGGSSLTITPAVPAAIKDPEENPFKVLVNGQLITAAVVNTATVDNQTVAVMVLEDEKIGEIIDQQDNNAVVTLSINSGTDIEIFQLNGQTIKIMENKKAVLEIKTSNVTYKLPAAQINIDNILAQIGNQVELKDITINVQVSSPPSDTVRMIEDIASKNSYQVVIEPLEFKIICTSGNRSMEISEFNGYVERMIALPDDIDPEKITTGIVLNPDGTVTHVPTLIMVVDGKNYVKINSLTNSTYSAIWNPRSFDDVAFHWAKNDINDMGSRLIIDGVGEGNFEPDRDITRAEFTAIIIKALGLMRTGTGKSAFDDTAKDAWYYDAVSIACQYGIISGYGNGTFKAMDKITREQSISMIARAMEITGLKAELEDSEADKLLMVFGDSEQAASWSKENIASCIKTEIISGRSEKVLAPVDNITRAEAAVMVRRLLQKSKLI